jgi:uncharacterized protein (DUF1697 family)
MTKYVALLRAINVGGTGKLPMSDIAAVCRDAGFAGVETYIASCNVVFECKAAAPRVKAELEARLRTYAHKPIGVIVRTVSEMGAVVNANPFPKADPKFTYAIFLDEPPPSDVLVLARGRKDEDLRLGKREIFIYYPSGMGRSKLRIHAAERGTARNMNTVAKLVEIVSK